MSDIENEQDIDNISLNDEILLDAQGENQLVHADNIEDFREKVKRSGVVFISYIPEGMTVSFLRERFLKYGATRIYLAPENPNIKTQTRKRKAYKEGWVEFSNKLQAKMCEFELNGERIGGKKNIIFREDIWTIKYLNKFKWHHLIEKMSFQRKLREQRMKAGITQARREANFIEEKFEQSKMVARRNKKRLREENENINDNINEIVNDNINENINNNINNKIEEIDSRFDSNFNSDKLKSFQRNFHQRKPIFKK